MSRHKLDPIKPEHRDYEIVIGWDGSKNNFFGSVRKPRDNLADLGGEIVINIEKPRFPGDQDHGDLNKHFQEVVEAISKYASVDHDLRVTLWRDSQKEGSY